MSRRAPFLTLLSLLAVACTGNSSMAPSPEKSDQGYCALAFCGPGTICIESQESCVPEDELEPCGPEEFHLVCPSGELDACTIGDEFRYCTRVDPSTIACDIMLDVVCLDDEVDGCHNESTETHICVASEPIACSDTVATRACPLGETDGCLFGSSVVHECVPFPEGEVPCVFTEFGEPSCEEGFVNGCQTGETTTHECVASVDACGGCSDGEYCELNCQGPFGASPTCLPEGATC